MSASANASPDNIDVVSLLAAVARSWRSLVAVTLAAGGIAFAGFSLIKPSYMSEAQIAIVARGDVNPFAEPKSGSGGETIAVRMDREAINTHAKALLAPELAATVSADLKLAERAEFNGAAGTNASGVREQDRVLAVFAKRLGVVVTKDSRSIAIRFTAQDRELAAEVANRLGEVYRERLAARSISESNDVQKGLLPRIERLKQEVGEAESEVERFRGAANIFRGGSASGSLNDQQLGELAAAESKARTELSEADARARAARELMARGSAEVHPDVQKSPVLQKLVQDRARMEGDIAKATATMKEGHPAMKQLRSELAATERQIILEVRRVIDGLDKEVGVAGIRLTSIQKSLAEAKSRVVNTGGDQARLSQLEANAKAKRGELDRLQAQFEANRARADTRVVPVEVQFISQARPASEPTFPKPLPYTALVMLSALLLSSSLLIARELIVGARVPARGRRAAEADPLGDGDAPTLAQTAFSELGIEAAVVAQPDRSDKDHVESIADLADRLLARRVEQRALRTLLAGAGASIDPSAEAVDLARAIARTGTTVLVIDWSLDGTGVARLLGIPASPGLAELIDGKTGFVGAITRIPGSAAHVIASGADLVSASGRGDLDRLNLLLDTLDEIYGQIIVSARFNAARDLFETIEGRFDLGVLIGEPPRRANANELASRMFLGFDVEDLEIVRLARNVQSARRRPANRRDEAA